MSRVLRILGTILVIVIAVIQFPQVWASPPRWLVLLLALLAVLCFLLTEILTLRSERREKRGQAERDQKLIEATISQYLSKSQTKDEAIQPESKYQELTVTQITDRGSGEEGKAAALHAPILKSHFIRSHLMPRSPWQSLIEGVFRATGRTEYEVETDFLYELFLVNTTENQVTVKDFIAEVQIGQEWKKLKRLEDLTDYKIQAEEGYKGYKTSLKDLISLAKTVENVPLRRGVGYRGWLRFEFKASRANLEGQVHSRVKIIDALGGEHEVDASQPRDSSQGELIHNPQNV